MSINKQKRHSYYSIVVTTVVVSSCILLTYLFFFFLHIHTPNDKESFTYSKSDLGTFGDLIGGVLNPLLTFITIGLLLWSIRIQGKELSAATEQSEKAAIALQQTQKIHEETMRKAERDQIYNNTKEKFENSINEFKVKISDHICGVNFRSDSRQTVYTQFSFISVSKYSEPELKSISEALNHRNDMPKILNALKMLEFLSQSITIHTKAYIRYNVPSIYYADYFLNYHDQLNGICAHLTTIVGESSLRELSEILDQNELLAHKIMSIST